MPVFGLGDYKKGTSRHSFIYFTRSISSRHTIDYIHTGSYAYLKRILVLDRLLYPEFGKHDDHTVTSWKKVHENDSNCYETPQPGLFSIIL